MINCLVCHLIRGTKRPRPILSDGANAATDDLKRPSLSAQVYNVLRGCATYIPTLDLGALESRKH